MAVERAAGGTSLIDVLDRVLDKGIVIDAWVRVSLVGIDLITVEARVVVASIDTYLKYSEAVGQVSPVSRPQAELTAHQNVIAENAALRAELAATKNSRGRAAAEARSPPKDRRRITSAWGRGAGRPGRGRRAGSEARVGGVSPGQHRSAGVRPTRGGLARRADPHQTRRRRPRRSLDPSAGHRRRARCLQLRHRRLRAHPRRRSAPADQGDASARADLFRQPAAVVQGADRAGVSTVCPCAATTAIRRAGCC